MTATQNPELRTQNPLSTQHSALSTQRWAVAAVAAVTVVGLGLRLYAIGHGLPYQYVPDESTMVGGALRMGATKSLEPGTFIYPAMLMYLFAGEYLGLLGVGRLTGLFSSVEQFRNFAFLDPTLFYLLPRIAIALIGAACIPLAYMVARRLYGTTAGVVAAFLVATSVMHVQMSHQARHWVPIALLTLVILWCSLDLAEKGRRRDYLLCGLLVGLAAATSFNGFLLMLMPIIAHLQRALMPVAYLKAGKERNEKGVLGTPQTPPGAAPWTRLRIHIPIVLAIVAAPIVFFVLNPFILLHFDQFRAFQTSGDRSIGGQILGHYDNYLQQLLSRQGFTFFAEATIAYEPAITILGVVGAILAIRRFRSTALVALAYPVFHYLMFATTAPSMEQRYMLPAVMVLALPAGLAASLGISWLGRKSGSRLATAAVVALLAVLISVPALRYDWVLGQPDTRTLAKTWIEANIPEGSDVAVESYTPPLTADLVSLRTQQQSDPGSLGTRDQWVLENGLPPGEVPYRLTRLNLIDTSPSVDNVTPYLATHHHRYFVVSDFRWKAEHLGHLALEQYLARNGRLIQAFYPSQDSAYVPSDMLNNMEDPLSELFKVARPGPRIEIYEVDQ